MKSHATASLFSVFGNALAVATSPDLLCQFLSLPHVAVYELLKSARLQTDAEATLLLLLGEWCDGRMGMHCSSDQLEQLYGCIRYSRLSTPYLTDLCTSLYMPFISTQERMELVYFRSLPIDAQEFSAKLGQLHNLADWYLPRRPTPVLPNAPVLLLTLKVSEADLLKFLRATKLRSDAGSQNPDQSLQPRFFTTKPMYAHGFLWSLILTGLDKVLWCGITAHGAASLHNVDEWLELTHGIMCRYEISIFGKTGTPSKRLSNIRYSPVNSKGIGNRLNADCGGTTLNPLSSQWWEPHMVDGFATIEATVHEIAF